MTGTALSHVDHSACLDTRIRPIVTGTTLEPPYSRLAHEIVMLDATPKIMDAWELAKQYNVQDLRERVIKEVHVPAGIANDGDFYAQIGDQVLPNIGFLRKHFFREGKLTEQQIFFILSKVMEIFKAEPNVLRLQAPITICGDIHGQYYDLVHMMSPELGGNPLRSAYLFLGDYVDRGYFSVECVLFLFAIKIAAPQTFHLLRGNHESRHLTSFFTFKLECLRKYSELVYDAFMEVFDTLPLAAIVDNQFFCAHGGISPDMDTIDDLDMINRFQEPPDSGVMCDILWSDPAEELNTLMDMSFPQNRVRGCSYYYTYHDTCKFLKRNGLKCIIRAHEAQVEGYRMYRATPEGFASIITVFSAPNYCDAYGNKGAILHYDGEKVGIRWYHHSPHPFVLANMMDAFSWSLPFVAEKTIDILQTILDIFHPDELESSDSDTGTPQHFSQTSLPQPQGRAQPGSAMGHIYTMLRSDTEGATEFRNLPSPPPGGPSLTAQGGNTSLGFDHARESDILNERLPPHIIEPNQARDYFGRRGLYSLEESAERLARTTSVGTTYSSSPSTRKRSIEASVVLVQQTKLLLNAAANESGGDSGTADGEIRAKGLQTQGLQNVLGLLKELQERERKAGSQLAEVMGVVDDLSFKPETDSSQMTVSPT